MIEENEINDAKLSKRVNYLFQEFDQLKSRYEIEVPGIQARLHQVESRQHELSQKIISIDERIPNDSQQMIRGLARLENKVMDLEKEDMKRYEEVSGDIK